MSLDTVIDQDVAHQANQFCPTDDGDISTHLSARSDGQTDGRMNPGVSISKSFVVVVCVVKRHLGQWNGATDIMVISAAPPPPSKGAHIDFRFKN